MAAIGGLLLGMAAFPHPAMGRPAGRIDLIPTMTLVGDAQRSTAELWLTTDAPSQLGAAWSADAFDVANGFSARFSIRISGGWGADGFGFVIQAAGGQEIGSGGGAIGYGEEDSTPEIEAIANSLAVEFDTFANWQERDPIGLDISVHTRGTQPNDQSEDYSIGSTTDVPPFTNGKVHRFAVVYQPGTLSILGEGGQELLSVAVDLSTLLNLDQGRAWLGFTAATGDVTEGHQILSFSVT
jgi:Bacterial lectin